MENNSSFENADYRNSMYEPDYGEQVTTAVTWDLDDIEIGEEVGETLPDPEDLLRGLGIEDDASEPEGEPESESEGEEPACADSIENDEIGVGTFYNSVRLDPEQEKAYLAAAQQGDELSSEILIKSVMGDVYRVAKKHLPRTNQCTITLDDLIQTGMMGAYKAIMKFDLTQDVKFLTYAHNYIVKAIKRDCYKFGRLIKIPETTHIEWANIYKRISAANAAAGRDLSYQELSQELGVPEETVRNILERYVERYVSFDSTVDTGDDGERSIQDVLEEAYDFDETPGGDHFLDKIQGREDREVALDIIQNSLNDKDRFLIRSIYGIDAEGENTEKLTYKQVSEKLYTDFGCSGSNGELPSKQAVDAARKRAVDKLAKLYYNKMASRG